MRILSPVPISISRRCKIQTEAETLTCGQALLSKIIVFRRVDTVIIFFLGYYNPYIRKKQEGNICARAVKSTGFFKFSPLQMKKTLKIKAFSMLIGGDEGN